MFRTQFLIILDQIHIKYGKWTGSGLYRVLKSTYHTIGATPFVGVKFPISNRFLLVTEFGIATNYYFGGKPYLDVGDKQKRTSIAYFDVDDKKLMNSISISYLF